ncbi:DUF2789 domain-containing protein [Methyloversatilis thermotolerans]|uniref:DUF2789 domain-containing protein n=1 Tax=Methyloversatilis thermotolerans TaxID=1346290 RepID=UPI00037C203A|nr:DUF2789 domain-containing protein [Methyloversatilis thermotolerans]
MDITPNSMENLFDQLGLPSDPQSIESFIDLFGPLDNGTRLHEATCWNPSQASFLRDALNQDADWIETVDTLNAQLHA